MSQGGQVPKGKLSKGRRDRRRGSTWTLAAMRLRRCPHCGRSRVLVVEPPPLVRRCLRVPVRRVLPLLLPSERSQVQVAPGASHGLVTAVVDEVGAEDTFAFAEERVG